MLAHVNGTTLHYEIEGRGIPLLLMHGIGFSHAMLRPWFDRLAGQAQLIYYDHRGHGRSARPESLSAVDHATWVADADALRAHLGHERVVVFGHSYGGFLAQEYALRYGDRVAGLVLCSTAPAVDYGETILANAAARATPEQLEAVRAALGRPLRDDDEWRSIWRTMLPVYFQRFTPALGELLDRQTSYSAAAYNHANSACLPTFNTLPALQCIQAPTLILNGASDWITPVEFGASRLRKAIGGSRLVTFERSGHFPYIEESADFFAVLGAWLAKLAAVSSAAGA